MTRLILWAILAYILIRVGWRVCARRPRRPWLSAAGGWRRDGRSVRDPVCGTFVLPSRALTFGQPGTNTTVLSASEKCRQDYSSKR